VNKRSHWRRLWTATPPLDEAEGIRRFVDAELEETRAFVRRLLAEHQRLLAPAHASSPAGKQEPDKNEGLRLA
jgi:hypothetical protein